MITADLLRQVMPRAGAAADLYAPFLEAARRAYVGDDWHRIAMWLAQIAHESGSLQYVRELASGEAYEGRRDLGNTQPGDGPLFRGRGLLQVTGRTNYERCGRALGLPLTTEPWLLEQPEHAAMSAGWVWLDFGLSGLCTAVDPVLAVTRKLNGGTNGLEDRRERYVTALTALKLWASTPTLSQAAGATPPGPVVSPAPPPVPAPPAPSIKETIVAIPALVAAAASALLPIVADLFRARGSKTSTRNAEILDQVGDAAPVLVSIAKEVAGGGNEQQAAEAILASKELQQQFRAQVALKWSDLEPFLRFEEESRQSAREFVDTMTSSGPQWRQIGWGVLIGVLSLLIVTGIGYTFWHVLFSADSAFSQSTRDGVVELMKNVAILVIGFFFGSSASNRQKDVTIAEQSKR